MDTIAINTNNKKIVDGQIKKRNAVPDIIVHKRMSENNFLVIKVKKAQIRKSGDRYLVKLNAFKEQLG